MTKIRVYFDENGQVSAGSVARDLGTGAAISLTPEMIGKMTPVATDEIQAFDPMTGRDITVRDGERPAIARMRAAIEDNAYKALSQGYFAGEPIEDNTTQASEFIREFTRGLTSVGINAAPSAGAMAAASWSEMLSSGDAVKLGIAPAPDKAKKMPEIAILFGDEISQDEIRATRDEYLKTIAKNDARLTQWLGKNRGKFGGDVGGAIGNLTALIGMSVLAGPIGGTATAAVMGAESGASILNEGIEAGLADADAFSHAMDYAVAEGILERVGIGLLWKSTSKRLATKAVRGFIVEGSEEGFQSVFEDITMHDVRNKGVRDVLHDAAYAFLVGGIAGAPAGMVEGGAVVNKKLRDEYVHKLKEQGIGEESANKMIDAVAEISRNKKEVASTLREVIADQLDTVRTVQDSGGSTIYESIGRDSIAQARANMDIREAVKERAGDMDENTKNVVADAVQNFADVIADDFGITQRAFLESTGLQIQSDNKVMGAVRFADGTRIDETGNLLDKDGNVLFQRIGRKGATNQEIDALEQALQMEAAGFDNDSIKKSTGWARGLDGKMWMESGGGWAILNGALEKLAHVRNGGEIQLDEIVDTDNFKRYPQLATVKVRVVKEPTANFAMRVSNGRIDINASKIKSAGDIRVSLLRSLIHEADHLIAQYEGFARGSNPNPSTVAKQVKFHEKHLFEGLGELGLRDEFDAALEAQGKDKSYVAALDAVFGKAYEAGDVRDQALRKKLKALRNDAIIIDRYGDQALSRLSKKEKEQRLREAYIATVGELYARRASDNANRTMEALRDEADETGIKIPDVDEDVFIAPAPTGRTAVSTQADLDASAGTGNIYHQDGDLDVRGYFDFSNKMQQIIQIMKSGDLDTVLHELGHFFSVNYINMAIETGKTEKIQPLLEYYKIETPARLISDDKIQEDLAVKFLTYLKTDQSPRGFRKYFDAARDWLVKAWDSLRSKGLVQNGELPDEIVRFFDGITIRRPKNVNLQSAMNEKARLKKILHDARVGKLEGVSDADIHTIEELLKTATARIPRMPKSLRTKLWGQLNTRFAETHDLLPLMGIDEKAKYLATNKTGGIKDEQGLLDWMQENGFMFGDGWSNNAAQDMMRWDDALRLIGNAKNTYAIDDAVRVQEIENLRQAQEIARDILDGQDSYNALVDIDSAKSAIQRVNDAVDRNKALNKMLAADYKKVSAEVRKAKAGTSEMRKAVKAAINFLYAQDLPTDTKVKFMRSVVQVHDSRSLAKWLQDVRNRAADEYSEQAFRGQRDKLNHELKETFSRNKNNIKYDYEHNRLFTDLRQYNMMSADKAQEEIRQFYDGETEKDGLSRGDQLRKMMLEYRANLPRRQMSGAFMDELIGRVQEAKLIGRGAIDDIQFNRGLERLEAHKEILDALDNNKAGKLDKAYAGISDFKSLLTTITNKQIADRFDMVVPEIKAGIAAAQRQAETAAEVLRINNIDVGTSVRRQTFAFIKYKAQMCEPIEGLHVFYNDHNGRRVAVGVDDGKPTFSKAHILDMYNQYKDPKSRELMNLFYGEWQIKHLFSYLTEVDIQTADYLMERLGDVYDMVNPVYVALYQKDMPRKKIYWPRQSNHEVDHELMERFDGTAREANFTKSRSHGAVPVFKRDVFSNYQAHEKDAQYMVHQAKKFKEAADIFDNSTIKETITAKFGKDVATELSEHLKALSIGGVRKSRASGDKFLSQFFGNIVGAKVNFSPVVMIKQLTSFGAYAANMPTGRFYADFAAGVAAPRKTYRYMMEHAGDYLRNRFSKGHNETLSVLIDPTQKNFMDKILGAENRAAFNEFLSRTVRTGDIGAIIYGGYPRLKFLIEERGEDGKPRRTHDEAVEQFIRESEESQQSSTNAAQSNWQRTGKTKIFAMYKTSQIQYFRKVANAYNMMKRGEISREQFRKIAFIYTAQMAVAYTLMGELLSGILYGWDEDKGLVDELESLGLAIIAQAFDAWGVIGYLANQAISVVSGQKRQADLSLVGYSDVMQTINNANKIIKGKGGNAYFWVQTIAPLIEGTTGAPLGRYNRAARKTGLYDTIGI